MPLPFCGRPSCILDWFSVHFRNRWGLFETLYSRKTTFNFDVSKGSISVGLVHTRIKLDTSGVVLKGFCEVLWPDGLVAFGSLILCSFLFVDFGGFVFEVAFGVKLFLLLCIENGVLLFDFFIAFNHIRPFLNFLFYLGFHFGFHGIIEHSSSTSYALFTFELDPTLQSDRSMRLWVPWRNHHPFRWVWWPSSGGIFWWFRISTWSRCFPTLYLPKMCTFEFYNNFKFSLLYFQQQSLKIQHFLAFLGSRTRLGCSLSPSPSSPTSQTRAQILREVPFRVASNPSTTSSFLLAVPISLFFPPTHQAFPIFVSHQQFLRLQVPECRKQRQCRRCCPSCRMLWLTWDSCRWRLAYWRHGHTSIFRVTRRGRFPTLHRIQTSLLSQSPK